MSRKRLLEVGSTVVLLLLVAGCVCGFLVQREQRRRASLALARTLQKQFQELFHTGTSTVGAGEVQRLVNEGADVNVRDSKGVSALELAVMAGDSESAHLLVREGADVNTRGPEGLTPLHLALVGEDRTLVQELLRRGADVNTRGPEGLTSLHWATDKPESAQELLAAGAAVDAQDDEGWTALTLAAASEESRDRLAVIRILLAAGANPELRDGSGRTALILAKERGHHRAAKLLRQVAARGARAHLHDRDQPDGRRNTLRNGAVSRR